MPADIVHEATYDLPADAVWAAIATKPGLDAWMMQNDFGAATVGHAFTFTDRPRPFWDGKCPCEVTEAEAPRRFALRWNTRDKAPSTVTFSLTALPGGRTRLEFRHGGLTGFMGLLMKKGMEKGWGVMVRHSIPLVASRIHATGAPPPRDEVEADFKAALKRRA